MRIFISYASNDERTAQEIRYALGQLGHGVFIGSGGLEPAEGYHTRLQEQVASSDLFIFLISADLVAARRYTLTELGYARRTWPTPEGAVSRWCSIPQPRELVSPPARTKPPEHGPARTSRCADAASSPDQTSRTRSASTREVELRVQLVEWPGVA